MDKVRVVGIETTCDETSVGILEFYPKKLREISKIPDFRELSLVILSQDFHSLYGGVVPELASRAHLRNIAPVFKEALKKAGISAQDIDVISVASEPGLPGSLIVGVSFAKALAQALSKKIVMVNHVEAHAISPLIENDFGFPFFSLIVSGGHSSLYLIEGIGKYRLLLKTQDDAAGEAFDKIAKLLRLGYPGGPIIDEMSNGASPLFQFPKVESENFSFSGIKTFCVRTVKRWIGPFPIPEFLASFQKKVIDELIEKSLNKIKSVAGEKREKIIVVAGGVARNSYFRKVASEKEKEEGVKFIFPSMRYCVDNGSMIAFLGGLKYILFGETSPFYRDIRPTGILKAKGGIDHDYDTDKKRNNS